MDITAGYRSVELMKQYVARTMNEHCIGGLGGFGGLFELDCTGYKHPVLISGTDGVGTKLKIAMIMDKHDTIGIDCVAMCVNDVICAGAKPLVFLDYIACGRNIPEKIAEIVKGVAEGCVQADCSLVGGETAEHPGMMPEEEYDLAGFTVGVVDKEKILNNETMKPGDVIIALPSTGVHSNGFSLVRKIFDIDGDPAVLKTAPAELGYLSTEHVVQLAQNANCGFCTACFTGKYAVKPEEVLSTDIHERHLNDRPKDEKKLGE